MSTHPFDPDQRLAVDISTNAVIAAGAGSGKTTVLAGRYLRLVQQGAKIPEILTLTFTRKAAAEMYSRIHRLLADHADDELVRQQLSLFDQARISTLDSFCSRLARNDASRFGLPLSFTVDQEGLSAAAESLALDFILRHHRNEALKTLIAANGFETVWKEFFARYAVHELRISDIPDHRGDFHRQEQACRRQVAEAFAQLDALYEQAGRAAGGKGKTATAAAEAAREWPDTGELIEDEEWEKLTRLASLRPYRKPGSNTTDPDLLILREIHETLSEAGEQAVSGLAILAMRSTYLGLMELMDLFAVEWRELKQRRGIVSFADIVTMAVVLLTENTELRTYYKKQFSHIMIDEFQDNNEIQKELLYLLAEKEDRTSAGIPAPEDLDPARLFFVGDEKQSIYRFRGADVSVFKRLSRELGGKSIELGTNYRSDPRLIEGFNRFFPRIFENSEGLDFEAEFRALKGRKPDIQAPEPVFRLHLLAEQEEDGETDYLTAVESEAFEAARLISTAVAGEGLGLAGDDGKRRPDYSDFALLLRSTGNQIIYERIFRRFGIPYTTENIRTLFLEAPANDIYAALQTAIYPEERLSYAVYLRSFFVNLDDESLIRELLEESPPFSSDTSDWPAVEAEKYRIGGEIFHSLRTRIDQVPHREIIRQLWFEHGYRYNLLKQPAYHGYLEFYDYLTALADRSWDAGESMALFLDFLRENLGDYKKLEEIEVIKDRQEGVRIMTVHKSKGLEFPIVMLGSAGQGSAFSGKRSPYYMDTEYGLTVNLSHRTAAGKQKFNPFYERGRAENERRESAELKRLLYVACTRAEQHMIILGHQPKRSSGSTPSLLDLTLTGFGCTLEEPDPTRITPYSRIARSELNKIAVRSRSVPPFAAYAEAVNREPFSMPPSDTPVSVSRLNSAIAERMHGNTAIEDELLPALPVDELIHNREEQFGTIVHRCLELLIAGRDPVHELEPIEGWTPTAAAEIAAAARELAFSFWNSDVRRQLIPDDSEPAVEVPFSLALPAGNEAGNSRLIIDGMIDLYVDRGDYILCVDFKTNRRRREGEYALQMWLYRRALEKLTRRKVVTCLVYLREGVPRYETAEFDPATITALSRAGGGIETE